MSATASDIVDMLVDADSFTEWPTGLSSTDPLQFRDRLAYRDRLQQARAATGSGQSVRVGCGRLAGRPIVLLVSEFAFLGGTIGVVEGEAVAGAFDRATAERLPVVAVVRTGGTRMQEGNHGFAQLAKTTVAVNRFRAAGLPYLLFLAHPSTGGVLASWGGLAHVTLAEPGALIGFSGPRVVELTTGTPLPAGVQTAENLAAHGLIDDVVPLARLRDRLARLLAVVHPQARPRPRRPQAGPPAATGPVDPWEAVTRTRQANRPGARELLAGAGELTLLHGDGQGGPDDPAIVLCLCRLSGEPVVVIAEDRRAGPPGPDGVRKARRGIALAAELGLALVTVVDTPGVQLTRAAEEGGLAMQLAACLAELLDTPAATVAVLLGEGGGGGALALLPADRVIAAQYAWLAPIAPEGGSAILYRTAQRAPDLANQQGITADRLRDLGLVDVVLSEDDGWHHRVAGAVGDALATLADQHPEDRLADRRRRYREIATGAVRRCPADPGDDGEPGDHGEPGACHDRPPARAPSTRA